MAKKRPDGWWYPWIFVAGFAVVIGVNGALMYYATSTFNGLETSNAFEKGNTYNSEIAAAERQDALGWTAQMQAEGEEVMPGEAARTMTLTLSLSDRDGAPLDGASVSAQIRRPTVTGFDQEISLAPTGPGTYGQVVPLAMAGQWDVQIIATRGGDKYRLRDRVVLR